MWLQWGFGCWFATVPSTCERVGVLLVVIAGISWLVPGQGNPAKAVSVFPFRTSFLTLEPPGPGSEIRTRIDWTQVEKTVRSELWWFPGAIGPHTGARCWPLLIKMWRAFALLMQPWCAEAEVPTAAKLNLHLGWQLRMGWHSDDEPLFGEIGMEKLIVSVSFGTQAVSKRKGKSCSDGEASFVTVGNRNG